MGTNVGSQGGPVGDIEARCGAHPTASGPQNAPVLRLRRLVKNTHLSTLD